MQLCQSLGQSISEKSKYVHHNPEHVQKKPSSINVLEDDIRKIEIFGNIKGNINENLDRTEI